VALGNIVVLISVVSGIVFAIFVVTGNIVVLIFVVS